jgi:hypothetical protein
MAPRELALHASQRVHKPVDYLDPCATDVVWSRAGSHADCPATGSQPRLSTQAWPHHCLACARRQRAPPHQARYVRVVGVLDVEGCQDRHGRGIGGDGRRRGDQGCVLLRSVAAVAVAEEASATHDWFPNVA